MNTVLSRSLVWGGVFAAVLLVAAGTIGWYAAGGVRGLLGALVAVAAAVVYLGLTTVSILVGSRISARRGDSVVFFAIVAGTWLLKLVVFLILLISLRGAVWMDPAVFGITLVIAVVGLLATDVVVMIRSRVPLLDVTGIGTDEPGPGA